MQEKYETKDDHFWILDEELGIDLEDSLGEEEKGFFLNEKPRYVVYRKKGLLHGPSIFYAKNGQLLSQTWYFQGKKQGKVRRYYPTNQLYSLERYIDGMAHLIHEFYYLDGLLKTSISYDRGQFHGKTKLFWPDGNLKRECQFSHGKKQWDKIYDEKGELLGNMERALS